MAKDAVFTLELDADLRDAFLAEAAAADRPAPQIVRDLMRDFVERSKEERGYTEFLRRKVELAEADFQAGRWRTNEEVEKDFAARRADLRRRAGGADA